MLCCQVKVGTLGWSPVQRSPTEWDVLDCDREALAQKKLRPTKGHCATKKLYVFLNFRYIRLCLTLHMLICIQTPNIDVFHQFFCPMPPSHFLVDFVVLPPGHGRSVTDFWVLDAHVAQLRCPDDVSGDIGVCSARTALKPKFYQPTQTMVTAGILSFRENSHGRAGNRTRDLVISSQRLWPLDHEAGLISKNQFL